MIIQKGSKKIGSIKPLGLIVLMLLMGLLFTSCGRTSTTNSALESLSIVNQDKGTIAVIKNISDEETIKKVTKLTTLNFDDSTETLLLVPIHNDSTIEIKNLTWNNVELIESGTAYKVERTEDGYGLYLRAIRPEGAPLIKIIVTSPQGQGEYLLTYNGKDGTPEMETIKVK